ncbi:hypothetical protein L0128_23155 [candidate division KSB1 bacterium]|nr:hypothetical protein [candidate division KSB1 bacterium]
MSDQHRKTNGLVLPTFDPKKSAAFARKVLDDLEIKCVLIGRLAVWYWLPDPSSHAYTKDLDTAIRKADRPKVIGHLVPDKLNSVLFWQKIENPHWGRTGRNSQFSIVNIQLKTSIIKTLNLKLTF